MKNLGDFKMTNNLNRVETMRIVRIDSLDSMDETGRTAVADTYIESFKEPPYEELFTPDSANSALQLVIDKGGDLLIGATTENAIALAGGYPKDETIYYIEELAVLPAEQGKGFGRQMLVALMERARERNFTAFEIRTTANNTKALSLYDSVGFNPDGSAVLVDEIRQEGAIGLDRRIYLKNQEEESMEKNQIIRRATIAYPSGNTTAVIFDQLMDENREDLNDKIMAMWKQTMPTAPEIEQCCFVAEPRDSSAIARVEMFGGEFCGNATRSVIQILTKGGDYQGLIEVSGVERPLNFNVKNSVVTLEMPLPSDGEITRVVDEGMLVQLDGITQLVVTDNSSKTPRQLLGELLISNKYLLAEQSAVGVSYYDPLSKKADFCVWVKEVDTIFDETACGSGTCAIGIASAMSSKANQDLKVLQPSGESIATSAQFDVETDSVVASNISGTVSILFEGDMELA